MQLNRISRLAKPPIHHLTQAMSSSTMPTSSTSSRDLSSPTTLEAALQQINFLKSQLASTTRAIHIVTGLSLDAFLEKGGEASVESLQAHEEGRPGSFAKSVEEEESKEDEVEPIDISPLILKALAIRKSVSGGSFGQDEAEKELQQLVVGLTPEQTGTIRQWAGL
ncbi:hypothetical protein P7C70_g2233, partial [Phenoliferia sp. Uapishka_3]